MSAAATVFDLSARARAKADPALIGADERQFAAIAESLQRSIDEAAARLDAELAAPGRKGQEAVQRDIEIRRVTGRLRALRRFGLDVCLGRIVPADGSDPLYIGRFGLDDADGGRLLVDWRTPAAEPFFAATHAEPMGLLSRRRYRWSRDRLHPRIVDYWDEVFEPDGLDGRAALDDQSAFIASLGASRSQKMRDVLSTIQADQDAIIRAGARGALVVDGGPGTGKTVVALHRSAYLLYSDPRISAHRGGVLFVGPNPGYLAYVADVLPALGEDGAHLATLRDLVPEGAAARAERDPRVASVKSSARMVDAIEAAVRCYEEPPAEGMTVETEWADLWLDPADWVEAFGSAEPGAPHNEARAQVWERLVDTLADQVPEDEELPAPSLRRQIQRNGELRSRFDRAWRLLDPARVVADLWEVPAFLRRCAPWLSADEVDVLRRSERADWTVSDLPLLDAARARIGDPEAARREQRRAAAVAFEREQIARVVEDLIAAQDDLEGLMSQLRHPDLQEALVDPEALPASDPDELAGPFAHIVVDEAQELTDAQWQMLLRRCPSRSFTIVGDRAQARHGFAGTWEERLGRAGLTNVEVATLTINYRTPEEVMERAAPVILGELPDANVPVSVRASGIPVIERPLTELGTLLDAWLAEHDEGTVAVISSEGSAGADRAGGADRVRALSPETAKGLEFDLVLLADPQAFGTGVEGAVDRYVAMTRATSQLVLLSG